MSCSINFSSDDMEGSQTQSSSLSHSPTPTHVILKPDEAEPMSENFQGAIGFRGQLTRRESVEVILPPKNRLHLHPS